AVPKKMESSEVLTATEPQSPPPPAVPLRTLFQAIRPVVASSAQMDPPTNGGIDSCCPMPAASPMNRKPSSTIGELQTPFAVEGNSVCHKTWPSDWDSATTWFRSEE